VDTAVAAPFKMRMLAPLKIWKWLNITTKATTEATAAAALGTDTPVVTATEAHREAVDMGDSTAVAAPLKRLAPLKIWKSLNITAKATEASTVAALGTETTEGAAAVMADPAADMAVTLDMVAASTPDTAVDIKHEDEH
jgi:hypothetical protein